MKKLVFLSVFVFIFLGIQTMAQDVESEEKVTSTYGYGKDYKIKPIKNQVVIIAKVFGLDPTRAIQETDNLPPLPTNAEGWFAIPRWKAVSDGYYGAIDTLIKIINDSPKSFHISMRKADLRKIKIYPKNFDSMEKISEKQDHSEILIVPAQFGLLHRGETNKYTRKNLSEKEFGLDLFSILCMLVTNPNRLDNEDCLEIDCVANAVKINEIKKFPTLFYFEGRLQIETVDELRMPYKKSSAPTALLIY